VDFLLALIELFSLRVTAEALRAIIGWKSAISLHWGSVDPKFQVEGVAPHQHSSSQKTRLNVLSTVLSQYTLVWQTDGQTDRHERTDGRTDRILITIPRLYYMQRGKNICYATSDTPNCRYLVRFSSLFLQSISIPSRHHVTRCSFRSLAGCTWRTREPCIAISLSAQDRQRLYMAR